MGILDKYGIKEVADVVFYSIGIDGKPDKPVLFLDTLKVSTIEQSAEVSEARGGKGNPALILWDFNKEINITLEDALFSAKSMAVMFGDGTVATDLTTVKKTVAWTGTTKPTNFKGPQGKTYAIPVSAKTYDEAGAEVTTDFEAGKTYYTTFDMPINSVGAITITANDFPGTYYLAGDTYARSEKTGIDEFFQFIVPKCKLLADNTITLEASGDPSVFNMNVRVLRPANGEMMKLVKYDITPETAGE